MIIDVSCFWRPSDFLVNSFIDLDIDKPQIVSFSFFFCGFWSYILNQDIKTIEGMSAGINPF